MNKSLRTPGTRRYSPPLFGEFLSELVYTLRISDFAVVPYGHDKSVRVSADPTFRVIGSPKLWDRGAALTSTLHWFETELLTREENLVGLMAVNREVLAQAEMATRVDRIVLDMDSSESPVHGAQEGSAYNGHFESVCYHPLFLFTEHGDCVGATLRPGNVHT